MSETLALVESPAQLLNVLEWAHTHRGEAPSLSIAVLMPLDDHSRFQVRRLCDYATRAGLEWQCYEIRSGLLERFRQIARLRRRMAAAHRLLIGDLFSGMIQTLLPVSRAREVVIVDDGTATTELASLLAYGRTLSRWHKQTERRSSRKDSVNRWLNRGSLERFTFFTCLPIVPPARTEIEYNDYTWIRSTFGPVRVLGGADLAGTSLVETEVIDQDHYLEALTHIAEEHRVWRYLAHRRESPEKLHRIAEATGMEIVHPALPLELSVRLEPIGRKILTFPSTIAYTLPIVLRRTPVQVELCDIDESWITPRTSDRSIEFLKRVSVLAVDRHALTRIPPPRTGNGGFRTPGSH
ncbi:hypothetical protein [Streptomyces nitrosporeus]|uniref:Uncharacterized protein n=1 Tax=Streptomyces nitrosporeus TaxID=28894 RepID=A0A5J6F7D0_9ACTN|nr:hypothetical protein [Streptomyces nitrosporeus]QEU71554.1 hypothetical protein CP967_05880 [Streptomyces nitrosporeus]GGZ11329.1 hypothetical protein GCM10010327_47600 [Streptomyces nitrosporeus]